MRIFVLLFLLTSFAQAQTLQDAIPVLDNDYLQSKQGKRHADLKGNRNAAGKINMDWARWQEWQRTKNTSRSSTQPDPWQNLGPDTISGRIISIAFHPTDANEFLVGSASGGLWRTNDYGDTWECLTDDYPTMGVGAVEYNPLDPSTILIATGEGYGFGNEFTSGFGILISRDNGVTWQTTGITASLSQSFAGMDLVWHPIDTSIVNAATSYGVYRSNDGGLTWSQTLAKLPSRMKVDPQNEDRIYLTARYYTSSFQGGLFISDDAGQTWIQSSNNGLPPDDEFGYSSLHIHEVYNNQIYIVVGQSSLFGTGPMRGLFKSSDYGATFTEITTNVDLMCYHPPFQSICQSWFANTIAVSPNDTNMMFCGGTRFRKSIDGGANWTSADLNATITGYTLHPDHHQTKFHPLTGDLIDCHDGGVGISSDSGETWISKSTGLLTHQFYDIAVSETNPERVIGGTQDVGAFTVLDAKVGGWKNPVGGDAFGVDIDRNNADVWYMTDLNFGRQKTIDAGQNWAQINNGAAQVDQWRMPINIDPKNSDKVFSSDNNSLYRSLNGGLLWSWTSSLSPIHSFAFDAVDSNLVYASELWDNELYRSVNGGASWTFINSPPATPVTGIFAHPTDGDVAFVTIGSFGANDQIYKTDNAGSSWTSISSGLPDVPMHGLAIDPFDGDVMYIGGDLGVWYTTNGGITWADYNNGLPVVVVEDIVYTSADTSLHIGTYGRGYWKTKAVDPPTSTGISGADGFQNLVVIPNPTEGIINISTGDDHQSGNIQLFDITGKLLVTQSFNSTNLISFDLSDFSDGNYILQIISAKHISRARIIKASN